jgi:hypothetical protein
VLERRHRGVERLELAPERLVERVVGRRDRLREQLILAPEVVDDARRTEPRALGHVSDSDVPEPALAQQLDGCREDLRPADGVEPAPGSG